MPKKPKEGKLTRRTFIRDGTFLGTGVVYSPLLIKLASCADEKASDDPPTSLNGYAAAIRAWELPGGAPDSIQVVGDGEAMETKLRDQIQYYGESFYRFA